VVDRRAGHGPRRLVSDPAVAALRVSTDRLAALAGPLGDAALAGRAYPTDWSVADVLSHIGSGAVIMRRQLEDGLAGGGTPPDFAASVWAEWNAKDDRTKRDEALVTDEGLVARLESLGDDEQAGLRIVMGPLTMDFALFARLRVNEHALHTWDIEVTIDPAATLVPAETAVAIDNLELIGRYTARPGTTTRRVTIGTVEPVRAFAVELSPGGSSFGPTAAGGEAESDVRMPAEALVRLVYGRLDRAHTPPAVVDPAGVLDELRRTFPGP